MARKKATDKKVEAETDNTSHSKFACDRCGNRRCAMLMEMMATKKPKPCPKFVE